MNNFFVRLCENPLCAFVVKSLRTLRFKKIAPQPNF
jgi:hypothetical protein